MACWLVHLIERSDGTLYCGVTNDIEKRLAAHHAGSHGPSILARMLLLGAVVLVRRMTYKPN